MQPQTEEVVGGIFHLHLQSKEQLCFQECFGAMWRFGFRSEARSTAV